MQRTEALALSRSDYLRSILCKKLALSLNAQMWLVDETEQFHWLRKIQFYIYIYLQYRWTVSQVLSYYILCYEYLIWDTLYSVLSSHKYENFHCIITAFIPCTHMSRVKSTQILHPKHSETSFVKPWSSRITWYYGMAQYQK